MHYFVVGVTCVLSGFVLGVIYGAGIKSELSLIRSHLKDILTNLSSKV